MTVRRVSLLMPCSRLEDLPMRLGGDDAADLLSAWTTIWHPALIDATGNLPGWHSVDELPEPETINDELVLVPTVSHERLPVDWVGRFAAAHPSGPPMCGRGHRGRKRLRRRWLRRRSRPIG